MIFWRWHGKPIARERLAARIPLVSEKMTEWERRANQAARQVRRGNTSAESEGRYAERQLAKWRGEGRAVMEALAEGDRKKREHDRPPAGPWRYWVRISYDVPQHECVIEVYFNERQGRRLTSEEAINAVSKVVTGERQPEIVWNVIRYGQHHASKRLANRQEASNFSFILDGDVEEIGEEQRTLIGGRKQWVRRRA